MATCDLCGGYVNLWFAKLTGGFRWSRHYYPRACINNLRELLKEINDVSHRANERKESCRYVRALLYIEDQTKKILQSSD